MLVAFGFAGLDLPSFLVPGLGITSLRFRVQSFGRGGLQLWGL